MIINYLQCVYLCTGYPRFPVPAEVPLVPLGQHVGQPHDASLDDGLVAAALPDHQVHVPRHLGGPRDPGLPGGTGRTPHTLPGGTLQIGHIYLRIQTKERRNNIRTKIDGSGSFCLKIDV